MPAAVITPAFFAGYRVVPQRPLWDMLALAARIEMGALGFRARVVDGAVPATPSLLCTNSTQTYDFMALMKALDDGGHRVVTVTKAKNFHNAAMAFVMKRTGVVPLASKGYFILADALATLGRRLSDVEYRALREHLDQGTPIDTGATATLASLAPLFTTPRIIAGHLFDPDAAPWRETMDAIYRASLRETVRLARSAVREGFHVQIYPEGTVSPTLGVGRNGAVQLAHALALPAVPIGMSGCPDAFFGKTPIPARGEVRIRIGAPVDVTLPREHRAFDASDEATNRPAMTAATARLMDAIDGLLEAPWRRHDATATGSATATATGKGLRAHL